MTNLTKSVIGLSLTALALTPSAVSASVAASIVSVPEPASVLLLVTGAVGLGVAARSRSRRDD